MNNKVITWIFIFLLAGLFGFAGAYVMSQNALLRLLRITYNRAELGDGVSLSRLVVNLYLNFINPSMVDVDVENYNFKVYMNNRFITNIVSTEPGYVAANATSVVKLTFVANPIEVLGNLFSAQVLSSLLFDYSKVIVRLVGSVSANHRGIGIKDIPVDISDNLQSLLYGTKTA